MFLAGFKTNQEYPYRREFTYVEFPKRFIYVKSSKTWQPRKQGHSIIRLTYIPAVCSVVYTKDGTHYKDITTVDGTKQKPSRRYPLHICFYITILGF